MLVNQEGNLLFSYRGLRSNSHLATKRKACASLDANSGGFSPVGSVLSAPDPCNYPAESQAARECRQAMSLRLLLVSDVASVSDRG